MTQGFCINGFATGGRTPLHHAVDAGKIDICQHLIKKGADPDVSTSFKYLVFN